MSRPIPHWPGRLLLCLATVTALLALPGGASAELVRTLEIGGDYASLRDADVDTLICHANGQFARLMISQPYVWDWRIEAGRTSRFDEVSFGFGTSITRHLPRAWNFSLGVGTGTGEILAPEYRFDASVGKGLLHETPLILTLGYTRIQSRGENRSDGVGLGLQYYFTEHWILGGHYLYDMGHPGDTISRSGGVGLTYSVWRRTDIGVGATFGKVSYMLIGQGQALVNYDSRGYNAGWSQWLSDDAGFNLRVDYGLWANIRTWGVTLSFFKEW